MNTLQFEPSPQIRLIQADADIAINGWDRPAIEIKLDGDLDQCTAEQVQNALNITSQAALALRIPKTTIVHVQQVSGDLSGLRGKKIAPGCAFGGNQPSSGGVVCCAVLSLRPCQVSRLPAA